MSGVYAGMQKVILDENPYAIYIPCGSHSLNLVGTSAVDCCLEAVNFFSIVQTLYNFFSASTHRWSVLKEHVEDNLLKKLSNTRWNAHAVATAAIRKSYEQILDALDSISEDEYQVGDTRKEARDISNTMQKFEFVFMLVLWDDILQHFHGTSQALQNPSSNLKVCSDLYESLANYLSDIRSDFDRFENMAKEIAPDVDYRRNVQRRRRRQRQVNDGDAEDVILNGRENFRVFTFFAIIDKLQTEMKIRGEIYKSTAEKFSFMLKMDLSHDELESHVERLVALYPDDINSNFASELQQFHRYVLLKIAEDKSINISYTDFYKIIIDDDLKLVFPNVEICLRIFLTLMITNCSGERSFSQLKRIKNPCRATMGQERLSSLALLAIESDVMRRINFDDLIIDFARQKCRKKAF